ncbi:MAG TPA: aminodeoxychorismate synthase component I [Solirubrobacterales bacterium]|nr:aminodeoxychorismate synthase component I [Solirubrobacterales bacterium]
MRHLGWLPDPESAFVHIYGDSPNAFWLDSSAVGERGRFSFMADSQGPLGAVVTYDVDARQVRVERRGQVELRDESIFDFLARELERLRHLSAALPFDFDCGFAGYFGYELKADCEGDAAHRTATPDAAFVFADRLIVFDHAERTTYLLCLSEAGGEDGAAEWMERTSARLANLRPLAALGPDPGERLEFELRRTRRHYAKDVEACKCHLAAGHSYEICLTNKLVAPGQPEPLSLYRSLRRVNPAPFAAYLRFGDLAVLSSSPERFLSVDRERRAEARPIKGTSRRAESKEEDARLAVALGADQKNRAENVTIVDLLRNDLGRVCEVGSVEVSELMRVETYETVHQLVSGVRGRLRGDLGAVECIHACFPPGSMTGAPKLRTMQIIDRLEGEARGPYSGAVGYLGLGGGCDLSVAIRTIVIDGEATTIGAGGAVVVDSDPEAEIEEMLLKATAVAAACNFRCRGRRAIRERDAREPHF